MSTFDKLGALAAGAFCAVLCLAVALGFVMAAAGAAAKKKGPRQ